MSGWIHEEIFSGLPLRRFRICSKYLREIGVPIGELMAGPNKKEGIIYCGMIIHRLLGGLGIPEDAKWVGVHRPFNMDAIELTFCHPDFPTISESCIVPVFEIQKTEDGVKLVEAT